MSNDRTTMNFDTWFHNLQQLAARHGESVADRDAWQESYMEGLNLNQAFFDEYPEHVSKAVIEPPALKAPKTPEAGDRFEHQNGMEYHILGRARDDYSGTDLVIHRGLHDGRLWSRPMQDFMGQKNGRPRFVHVGGLMTPAE